LASLPHFDDGGQERRLSVTEDRLEALLGTAKKNAVNLMQDSAKMANDTAQLADRTQDALIEAPSRI